MKIITCASYYGSGSSALSDLVAEYDSVKDLSEFEFRFLHDIDGVSDLEYHLCECHNRHNSGHALKRFMRLAKYNEGNRLNRRYNAFFNDQFSTLTNEYIKELIDFQFTGWWFYDLFDYGIDHYYRMQFLNKILRKISGGKAGVLKNEQTYCSHPSSEKFLEVTQTYLERLLHAANMEKLPFLQVDQLVPSQNTGRVLRYFRDPIEVFVVDRDPRDIYVLEKCYWKGHICPTDSVEKYCKWFLYTRKSGTEDISQLSNVHFIQFEDFIFNYNSVKSKIEHIIGLSPCDLTKEFTKLNPKKSINNTCVWRNHPELEEDIKIIEKELTGYLYQFEKYTDIDVPGIEVNSVKPF